MSTTLLSQNKTFKDSFFTSLHKTIHFLPAHNQRSAANLCRAAAGVPLEIFWRSPLHSCRRRSSAQCLGQGSEWALLLLLLLLFVRSYEAGKTCRARPSAHSLIPRRGLGPDQGEEGEMGDTTAYNQGEGKSLLAPPQGTFFFFSF